MRYSKLLIPTVKEDPAEAEVPSHKLMLRAGFIRKLASGTYTYLPLGWRSILKIIAIVRDEMNAAGAQEISMPILQPLELWQQTGRDVAYGPTMCKFEDRHGRWNALAPTAEEVVTSLAAGEISSHKQLPTNLYQINTKFRDEYRPRFGVLRSREFIMKDAYSFDADEKMLDESYHKMYDAYCRIFTRCGLKYVAVWAESGEMGGSGSQQFTVPCDNGEDVIVLTEDGQYAANLEKAPVDPPGGTTLQSCDSLITARRAVPPMLEVHTPNVGSIDAVCKFLGTEPAAMIKTLIYSLGEKVMAVLVRGDHEVNPEKLTQLFSGAHIELAGEGVIQKATGAAVGFAGPVNPSNPPSLTIIDHSVAAMVSGVAGANKTDHHVRNVVPGRDFPLDGPSVKVADVRNAAQGDTYQGKKLLFKRGIEVGQVFKLGTKYSAKLGAKYLALDGLQKPCLMGCYGIGINRILASAIEIGNDANGCILPVNIAPFEVEVLPLNMDNPAVVKEAERIYAALRAAGVDVLIDDRDARSGVKFKDADLIGIPVKVVVGERRVKEGKVELKRRTDKDAAIIDLGGEVEAVRQILAQMRT